MPTMMSPVDRITELFTARGAADYLGDDIVPASLPARLDGHGPLAVGVSRSAGMGPTPGLDRIRARAVRHQLIEVRPP